MMRSAKSEQKQLSMPTLERAIELAAHYHAGQKDKGGYPYILHPLAVMMRVDSELEKIVAVLHDTLEDTELTANDLREAGFPQMVIEAIEALTKKRGETRVAAAKRATQNPLARVVKIADVQENLRIERIPQPTTKDYERMREYQQVLQILETAE